MILHNEKLIFILKIAETFQIPATKKKRKFLRSSQENTYTETSVNYWFSPIAYTKQII